MFLHRALRPGLTAVAAVALAGSFSGPADAAQKPFEIAKCYEVQVDGAGVDGARVFKRRGSPELLLELPSQSTLFVIDTAAKTAFALRPENAVHSKDGKTVMVREQFAWSVPTSPEGRMGLRFPIGDAEVIIVRPATEGTDRHPCDQAQGTETPAAGEQAAPVTGSAPEVTAQPAMPAPASVAGPGKASASTPRSAAASRTGSASKANAPPARDCLSLEVRPASGIPDCARSVYIRNRCESPVQAVVQRTEHLMSGTLPQTLDVTVPPGEQWLGCSWWSGAMAPADHEIAGASFVP